MELLSCQESAVCSGCGKSITFENSNAFENGMCEVCMLDEYLEVACTKDERCDLKIKCSECSYYYQNEVSEGQDVCNVWFGVSIFGE